jgi:hypothetical protein
MNIRTAEKRVQTTRRRFNAVGSPHFQPNLHSRRHNHSGICRSRLFNTDLASQLSDLGSCKEALSRASRYEARSRLSCIYIASYQGNSSRLCLTMLDHGNKDHRFSLSTCSFEILSSFPHFNRAFHSWVELKACKWLCYSHCFFFFLSTAKL